MTTTEQEPTRMLNVIDLSAKSGTSHWKVSHEDYTLSSNTSSGTYCRLSIHPLKLESKGKVPMTFKLC